MSVSSAQSSRARERRRRGSSVTPRSARAATTASSGVPRSARPRSRRGGGSRGRGRRRRARATGAGRSRTRRSPRSRRTLRSRGRRSARSRGSRPCPSPRLDDEHAAGHGVGAPAGQVRERRVRAVRVVGVVRALLRGAGRDDEALAGVQLGDARPASGRVGGLLARRRRNVRTLGPVAVDELVERRRRRGRRAVRRQRDGLGSELGVGLRGSLSHAIHPPTRSQGPGQGWLALRLQLRDDGTVVAAGAVVPSR